MCASRYLHCSRMHFQSHCVCSSTTDHADECSVQQAHREKKTKQIHSSTLLVNDDDQVELDEWTRYCFLLFFSSLSTASSSASLLLLLARQTTVPCRCIHVLASVCFSSSAVCGCFFFLFFLLQLPILLTCLLASFATLKTVNSHEHSPVDLLVGRQSTFAGWG